MEFKLGQWNVFLTRHLCTCDVKTCKQLDKQPGVIKGCYRGNYFIIEKQNTNQKG